MAAMDKERVYANELRADSAILIIPIISITAVIFSLLGLATRQDTPNLWYQGSILILSPLVSRLSWKWIQAEKTVAGAGLFLSVHTALLTLVLLQEWQSGSAIPYVYILITVMSSMLLWPSAGFYAWSITSVGMLVGLLWQGVLTSPVLVELLPAIGLNLFVAISLYLTALEWETAVESVSMLHLRAQHRRDELFAIKEEVGQANDRLRFLNQELDKARQQAVTERDIRTRFMNNVSHELRTPLNSIVNFAHILSLGGVGPVTERQVDYLTRLEKSGWHLLNVLNDLLDMAQIESGEFKLYPEMINPATVCQEALDNVHGLVLEQESLELVADLPEPLPWVNADHMRLKQAVINLLGNAIKYTPEGRIILRARVNEEFLYLEVEDTGVGIAPEYHEIIFQEFRQVDETAARKRIGTGLGLPITRHLIEKHGGHLSLRSAVGQGSTFTIALPLAPKSDRESSSAKPEKGLIPAPGFVGVD